MKTKIFKPFAAFAAAFGIIASAPSALAANEYGIDYSGGQALGTNNNVKIDEKLLSSLTPLIAKSKLTSVDFSNSSLWKNVYAESEGSGCTARKALLVKAGDAISASSGLSYNMNTDQYRLNVVVEKVVIEDVDNKLGDKQVPVTFSPIDGGIYGAHKLFSDAKCENEIANVFDANHNSNVRFFVQLNSKLYKKGSNSVFTSDGLYLGVTDIDASQSYKILNSTNKLSPSNMYAKSAAALQPTDSDLRNMFVANSNYIYSEGSFNIDSGSNIFVSLNEATQKEGLKLVFGFHGVAGSALQYYANQFTVKYVSDDNGKITGITSEDIISGQNPTGTTDTPNKGYETTYWTADKDVTLTDGKVIKKGDKITAEQLKQVKVTSDITFTAHHVKTPDTPAVPNTGESTGEINGILIAAPVMIIALVALAMATLPRLHHKKMTFKK